VRLAYLNRAAVCKKTAVLDGAKTVRKADVGERRLIRSCQIREAWAGLISRSHAGRHFPFAFSANAANRNNQ
jgi:hypothetical protein